MENRLLGLALAATLSLALGGTGCEQVRAFLEGFDRADEATDTPAPDHVKTRRKPRHSKKVEEPPDPVARGPAACDIACSVCSSRDDEIEAMFGDRGIPDTFSWAMVYVEDHGLSAFRICVGGAKDKEAAAMEKDCDSIAHDACVRSCKRTEWKRKQTMARQQADTAENP